MDNNKIKVLDCTLRDGGYVNDWRFNQPAWKSIVRALIDSRIDIIELGYLNRKKGVAKDSSLFNSLTGPGDLLKQLASGHEKPFFCVMANLGDFNLDDFPADAAKEIGGVRLAFHKERIEEAAKAARELSKRGFKVFVQPMVTPAYSEAELARLIELFNGIAVYAVHIVDSFGLLYHDEFMRLWSFFHARLRPDIALGYHAHNNLQLAYANAIDFVENVTGRELIIDASVFGMGRGAGNLNTELLVHYLNRKKKGRYDISPLLECIDGYLEAIYRETPWGYSIAHFLSAAMGCHPNYASYLINKKTISVFEIREILGLIPEEKKRNYSKEYSEEIYRSFRGVRRAEANIPSGLFAGRDIVMLASGASVRQNMERITLHASHHRSCLIALNHVPSDLRPDYFFFSNQKRYNEFQGVIDKARLIVTGNIRISPEHRGCLVADYMSLVAGTGQQSDNVAILFLNFLIMQGIPSVHIAGLDGYRLQTEDNYSYQEYDRIVDREKLLSQNAEIAQALREVRAHIAIDFLTPTIFKEESK